MILVLQVFLANMIKPNSQYSPQAGYFYLWLLQAPRCLWERVAPQDRPVRTRVPVARMGCVLVCRDLLSSMGNVVSIRDLSPVSIKDHLSSFGFSIIKIFLMGIPMLVRRDRFFILTRPPAFQASNDDAAQIVLLPSRFQPGLGRAPTLWVRVQAPVVYVSASASTWLLFLHGGDIQNMSTHIGNIQGECQFWANCFMWWRKHSSPAFNCRKVLPCHRHIRDW